VQNNIARKLAQIPAGHLIVGIDPHKSMYAVVVMDQQAKIYTKFKIGNSRPDFERLVEKVQGQVAQAGATGVIFGIEAGSHYWRNLAYFLDEQGLVFQMVNPFTLKRQREGDDLDRRKNDYRDATAAAELMRNGKYTETRLLQGKYAELRALHQAHRRQNKENSRIVNLGRGLLDGLFPEFCRVFKSPFGKTAAAVLLACPSPELVASQTVDQFIATVRDNYQGTRLALKKLLVLHQVACNSVGVKAGSEAVTTELQMLVVSHQVLALQMERVDRQLHDLIQEFEEFKYVSTITGLGTLTIAGMVAEIGPLEHYGNAKDLVKLAGTNPIQSESADKGREHTPMSKKGRAGLRSCLWRAAIGLMRGNDEFQAWAEQLKNRASNANPLHKREVLGAVMNKLLRVYFALVSKKQTYQPKEKVKQAVAA